MNPDQALARQDCGSSAKPVLRSQPLRTAFGARSTAPLGSNLA